MNKTAQIDWVHFGQSEGHIATLPPRLAQTQTSYWNSTTSEEVPIQSFGLYI